jgi:hypothetical protein
MTKAQVERIMGPPTTIETKDMLISKKTTYRYEDGSKFALFTFKNDELDSKEGNLASRWLSPGRFAACSDALAVACARPVLVLLSSSLCVPISTSPGYRPIRPCLRNYKTPAVAGAL